MAVTFLQKDDPLFTRAEASRYLGVTVSTLAIWASTGRHRLEFVKYGNKTFYRKSVLDALRERCTVRPGQEG